MGTLVTRSARPAEYSQQSPKRRGPEREGQLRRYLGV